MRHWMSTHHDSGGEVAGRLCDCPIGEDHNERGELLDIRQDDDDERARGEDT